MADTVHPLLSVVETTPDPLETVDFSNTKLADAENPLDVSFKAAIEKEPDRTAQVVRTARSLGQPEEVVDNNLDAAKLADTRPPTEYFDEIIKRNPRVSKFLAHPPNMAMAKDDINNLTNFEDAVKTAASRLNPLNLPVGIDDQKKMLDNVASGWRSGRINVRQARVGWEQMFDSLNTGEWSQIGEEELAKIDAEAALLPEQPKGFSPAFFAGQQLPNFALMAERGALRAGQTAIVGTAGALGAAALTGPGAPAAATVTVPAGFFGGATLGGRLGVAEASAMLEGGLAFREFSQLRADNGARVNPRMAAQMALAVGIINAGLEYASASALLRTIPGGSKILGMIGDKKIFAKMTPGAALRKSAGAYLTSMATEGITEMTQEASVLTGANLLKAMASDFFTPSPHGADIARIMSVVAPTLQATMLLGMPGSIISIATDVQSMNRANKSAKLYADLQNQTSKLRERDAVTHETHVSEVVKGTPVENIYLDASAAQTYFQSQNLPMEEVAKELGVTEQLNGAIERGGMLEIPYSKWNAILGSTEHYTNLAGDVAFDPTERTINQAAAKASETAQLLVDQAQTAAKTDPAIADGMEFIYNDIKKKMEGKYTTTPQGEQLMDANARVFAAAIVNMPGRGNVDPKTFYQQMLPVEIESATAAPGESLQQAGRHATEEIAWNVRPDGTVNVSGDPVKIRKITQLYGIPVVGMPADGGLTFSSAHGNRVVSALRGDTVGTKGSRKGIVLEHELWQGGEKAGTIKGAPEAFNTVERLSVLQRGLKRAALEGEAGRFWYENSGKAILRMMNGDKDMAEKFSKILAVYSQSTGVAPNMTNALKAWYQWLGNQAIKAGRFGDQDRRASEILYDNKSWEGEKTNNFFGNLMRLIKPDEYADHQGVTNDMWMMRMFGYPNDSPTAQAYRFVETETNRLAQELGWEPQQVQAAIWTAIKTRAENSAVKNMTDAQSIAAKDLKMKTNNKGKVVRTFKDAKAEARHRERWFMNAMNADISPQEIAAQKFDFADALSVHEAQVSWESRPGRKTGILPEVNDATFEQQWEFHQAIMKALLGPTGENLLAEMMKLPVVGEFQGPGVYQNEFTPGSQTQFAVPPRHKPGTIDKGEKLTKEQKADKANEKKTLDPKTKESITAYAAIIGAILKQEAMAWHRPFYAAAKRDANGVEFATGQTILVDQAKALYTKLSQELASANLGIDIDAVGIVPSPDGVRVITFAPVDNVKFHKVVEKAFEESLGDSEASVFYFATDGDYVSNDWSVSPNGEDYFKRATEAGFKEAVTYATDILAPKIRAVHESFAEKYGWTNPYGRDGVGPAAEQAYQQSKVAPAKPEFSEVLKQGTPDDPRGFIAFGDTKTIIGLINADASTFVHELGHFWLKNFNAFVQSGKATEKHIADWKTLSDWLKIKEGQTDLTVSQQEKFARGFEAYIREGIAPSDGLRAAFRRFSRWLTKLYRDVKQLNVDLTSDVRGVMDRMLASEDEIAFARQAMGLDINPKMEGVDPAVVAKLTDLREEAHDRAVSELTQKMMRELKPERRDEYNRLLAEATKAAEAEVAEIPEQKAMEALERSLGGKAHDIAQKFVSNTLSKEDRVSFRMISDMQGYSSPQMMAKQILTAPPFSDEVARRVKFSMAEHEDLMNTDKVKEEAVRALANEKQTELLAYERAIFLALVDQAQSNQQEIKTRRADAKIEADAAKAKAEEIISNMPVHKAVQFMPYFTAARNAATDAYKAAAAGQFEKAADAKRKQMLNHALATESFRARQSVTKWGRYLNETRKKDKALFKREAHFNQVAAMMSRFGIERTDYNPTTRTENLQEWADMMIAQEAPVNIAGWLYNETITMPTRDLSVNQMHDLVDALKNIQRIANMENNFYRMMNGASIQNHIIDLRKEAAENNKQNAPEMIERKRGWFENLKKLKRGYDSQLRNAETILLKLGGWKDDSKWHSSLWGAAEQAGNAESPMIREFRDRYKAILSDHYTDKERADMVDDDEKIFVPELGQSVRKVSLIMMAMNTGTLSNRERLFESKIVGLPDGVAWGEEEAMSVLQKYLTANDWTFTQDIWDMLDALFPEMSKVHKEVTGFSPEKVSPHSFRVATSDGKQVSLRGGYFPLKADTRGNMLAEIRETLDQPLYTERNPAFVAATKTGHLKARKEQAKYPVALDISIIQNHLQEAIHDIAWRATVIDLRRLINNPDFRDIVLAYSSKEDYQVLRDWVGSAAAGNEKEKAVLSFWESSMKALRQKFTSAVIVMNPKVVTQNIANIFLYAGAVDGFGWQDVISGMTVHGLMYDLASLSKSKMATRTREYVYSKSSFMLDKKESPEYTLKDLAAKMFRNDHKLRDFFMGFMAATDELTSIPMWITAYEKAKSDGKSERDSVGYADNLIRRAIGPARKYQTSAIFRSGEMAKTFAVLQGFMNAQQNRWERERGILQKDYIKNATRFGGYLIAHYVVFAAMSQILSGNLPDFDDEDKLKRWLKGILLYRFQMLTGIGQIASVIADEALGLQSYGYKPVPQLAVLEKMMTAGVKTLKLASGEAEVADVAEAIIHAVSYGTGSPDQIANMFWNAYDIAFNDMNPQASDLIRRRPRADR